MDALPAFPTSHRAAVRSVLSSVANTFTIPEETASDLDNTKEGLFRNAREASESFCRPEAAEGAGASQQGQAVYVPPEVAATDAVQSPDRVGAAEVFESPRGA